MSHTNHNVGAGSKSIDTKVTDSVGNLSLDDVFGLLANSRRRAAIHVLFEHERMKFGELVDRVAEIEYRKPIEEIDNTSERHTVYVSLHQTHTEKLEDAGVLEKDSDTVSLGDNADEMQWCLSRMEKDGSLSDKIKQSFSALC